ncbi:hypothetical protein B0H21DRAFT_765352 [Amylocystis lapponica]|nr:hypothetical protein B0H21DRAFT_765352 [Amylocystis lapponica]
MNKSDWYSAQGVQYPQHHHPPDANRVAADSVQQAHRLLAVYPFASATPSTHVARHLSNLTLSAAPPSYVQSHHHHTQGAPMYPQAHYPPFVEYAHELNHLATASAPVHDGGYWESTRNEAVRYIGEQGFAYSYYQPSSWSQSYPSAHQSTPFAQSVFQHTMPTSSYPTPPPPGITNSSSSLANALGEPIQHQRTTKPVYHPDESPAFFNKFLAQTTAEIDSAKMDARSTPRRTRTTPKEEESPDPLALGQTTPYAATPASATPRKRKDAPRLESPSAKRIASGSKVTPGTKRKLQPFIEVPPIPKLYLTPTSERRSKTPLASAKGKARDIDGDDDLGGYGSEDNDYPPTSQSSAGVGASVKSSGKRATGERDDRAPLEKLTTLLEDIFEAEDALPPDVDANGLPPEFFSRLTADSLQPLLHPTTIRKLTNHLTKVARPRKRLRLSSKDGAVGGGTPRAQGRLAEVETATLSRILKMLERSVKAGEDLEPFGRPAGAGDASSASARVPSTPRKPKAKKAPKSDDRRSKSKTPKPPGDGEASEHESAVDEQATAQDATDADLEKLTEALDVARDSLLAADCIVALLGSDRLTKQLYSEELITTCLSTVKNQLTKVIYPFVEAPADAFGQTPLLRYIIQPGTRHSSHRQQLAEIFQAISSIIPRINDLIGADAMAMSESIIIQAVYIAIGPFFVVESGGENEGKGKKGSAVLNTLGNSAMRGLRLDALSLVRSVFANHESQRSWIIEEILSSLIKLSDTKQKAGQFRLRDGRSIRTVSALLLQLVQTSAHDVRIEAKTIRKARQQVLAMRRQENGSTKHHEPLLDEKDLEEIRLYTSGLDSATKAAKTIIIFLTQRSGKTKVTKNSNEAEYRAIFDNLISDLLAVLFWPEWPAASLLLSIICKFMVSSLDDVKTSQSDNNAMKTVALDHLGVIAARLRSTLLKFKNDNSSHDCLRPLDEISTTSDVKQLQRLISAHADVASHLCKRSSEDQACDSARELGAVIWGQELATALQQCTSIISDPGDEEFDPKVDRSKVLAFGSKVKDALRGIWEDTGMDVFDIGISHEEVARIDRLSEEIGTVQSFKNSFHPILNVVLQALDAPPVFMRTKALKALGQIVTSDPSILSAPNVRRAIESHLLDSSPAVRDAAVELIGKYMIDSPKFAADYFQKIAERIADTGLGVRKRVIKLLKSFYAVTDIRPRRVDICTRIVLRMLDEDDTVKDLAIKTMEELWFQGGSIGSASQKARSGSNAIQDKAELLMRVAVIMGVAGHFKDRQSPLEDLLHQIIADKEGDEAAILHRRYSDICETLIDGLVDASDLADFTVINCVRTIHLFTSAYPAVLSGSNASTLLPYLKNATTPEEQTTSDYLLRIFRASIPYMPKTAAKFGQELQLALQPMILKPSATAGILGLQETVSCMCAIVQHITHDFGRLVALLRSCNTRLQQAVTKGPSQAMSAPEQRALSILLFIASLLCEHCPFDKWKVEHENLRSDLNSITKGSVIEHVYHSLLGLYDKYRDAGFRGRILQCLGFLFRAQPALMTTDASASIMDTIFASPEEEARGRLLKIMQDFLFSEAAKHSAKEKANSKSKSALGNVNMEELVGNTDGFADSGVSSAVVQRYLDPILQAALSLNAQIQSAAVDILSFTIKQGLAHPLQSFPVIVALETSPNTSLSTRASALHAVLHSKHTSLLNARYVASARASFDYQKKLSAGSLSGYRMLPGPTALLQRWYALVREKRATRQDFLKALVKVFDVELSSTSSQDDIDFVRYMAENFAAFDYKTQEEVLTVLKYLTAVLSTTGMQLVEALSPSHLLAQLHAPSQSQAPEQHLDVPSSTLSVGVFDNLPLMRTSVIVAMVMLLKAYLKALYGLSEEKCSKWVVGKKGAVGDRPATRRHERALSWERLPFASAPMLTSADGDVQRTRFLEIWNEDGLTAEPEDELV